jgi:AcrR family transcriptional regulator
MSELSAAALGEAQQPRRRGRPALSIETDALLAAVEKLFSEGGLDAVTIERTAQELGVSRATLYRSVPSKEHLLGLLFERMTGELDRDAREVTRERDTTPRQRLEALIRVQIEAAVRMRDYFFVYFDGSGLPRGVYDNWRHWAHDYEQVWVKTVRAAIRSGDLPPGDPKLTTRLILGMTIWVANWFKPREGFTPEQVQERAVELLAFINKPE